MKQDTVNTNMRSDGTLEIYVGDKIMAEVENGRQNEDFVDDILFGLGYHWNDDGTITKIK